MDRHITKAISRGIKYGIPRRYLNTIEISNRKGKRFKIRYNDKYIHFGVWPYKTGTYIDHEDDNIRENWIKRHSKNKNWNNPSSPIFWAAYTLW